MEARSLDFVCRACGGELICGSPETKVLRVSTDSRQARAGDLFVAIKGEKFDGHDFVADVIAKGATAVLVERARAALGNAAVIAVEDTRKALGRFGARYRRDFRIPAIAVGGSNGKTTTKELIAAVLRQELPTVWSEASFNNDIGVPLTLLSIESQHRAAVLEVGTNHPGELPALVRLIEPGIGVITSIGREHLEHFHDVEGVANEEGWLAELLPSNGVLFLNGDSEWSERIARRSSARVMRVGTGAGNHWRGEFVAMRETGVMFRVSSPRADFNGEHEVGLLGRHQVTNAVFALAVAAELGLSADAARAGLATAKPPKMRMQFWEAGGVRVLEDCYNANADSMLAALQTLADLPCAGKRVAVLGDMAELGEHTAAAHEEIGRRAAELKIDGVVAVGGFAKRTADAAAAGGLEAKIFSDVGAAASELPKLVKAGDLILLKASRSTGLERVGEALRNPTQQKPL
jgi:UDP-N-acetylmuramoyl-tripeptide--D-alanyl-D-alanine ligase